MYSFVFREQCTSKHKIFTWRVASNADPRSHKHRHVLPPTLGKDSGTQTMPVPWSAPRCRQKNQGHFQFAVPAERPIRRGLSGTCFLMTSSVMQRRTALASAWNQVSMRHWKKIRALLDKEFKFFGYDLFLQDVFSPKEKIDENIFDLMNVWKILKPKLCSC